jgi:hypothetical protein
VQTRQHPNAEAVQSEVGSNDLVLGFIRRSTRIEGANQGRVSGALLNERVMTADAGSCQGFDAPVAAGPTGPLAGRHCLPVHRIVVRIAPDHPKYDNR